MTMLTPPAVQAAPSFVDLRAFAADLQAGESVPDDGNPWTSSRRLLPMPPGPVTIAALRLSAGSGHAAATPFDDYVILLSGRLRLNDGAETIIEPSRSFVVPAGIAFDWQADDDTVAIVMRCPGGTSDAQGLVKVDIDAPRTPSAPPAPEVLLTPTPDCRNHTDYLSATGEFKVGSWDSTPYHRSAIDYGHYEMMLLLDGEVEFEDPLSDTSATFRAGDVFVLLWGARCSWKHEGFCSKQYAIYRPA
jgi:uncharacterized cupin superfamily protein